MDWHRKIKDTILLREQLLQDKDLMGKVVLVGDLLVQCFQHQKKVLLCGNGGSAADAQHIAAELTGRYYFDRPPLDAEALHVNSSYLSAVANDYGYDQVFARLIKARGQSEDILITLSTSGASANILAAAEEAIARGMTVIAMTGAKKNPLEKLATHCLHMPSTDTPRIQELHLMIGHLWCEYVEARLFSPSK